jgi:putative ABC transport system permease protein
MTLKDTFGLAFKTVRSNKLRTGITVAIIAFGIMALIGIITAIEAMNGSLKESFSTMGANGFTMSYRERFRFNNNNNQVTAEKRNKRVKNLILTNLSAGKKQNILRTLMHILHVSVFL